MSLSATAILHRSAVLAIFGRKNQSGWVYEIQPLGLILGFTPAQTRAKGRDLWNPFFRSRGP